SIRGVSFAQKKTPAPVGSGGLGFLSRLDGRQPGTAPTRKLIRTRISTKRSAAAETATFWVSMLIAVSCTPAPSKFVAPQNTGEGRERKCKKQRAIISPGAPLERQFRCSLAII